MRNNIQNFHPPIVIGFLIFVLLSTLSACTGFISDERANPAEAVTKSQPPPTATITIRSSPTAAPTEIPSKFTGELEIGVLWDADKTIEIAHYEWIANSIEKEFPGTKIIFSYNDAAHRGEIQTRTLAGNPLDLDLLFDGLNPLTHLWAEDGYVMNLTPHLNQNNDGQGTWKSSINSLLLPSMMHNSSLYGVPDQVYYWVIFYNQTLFTDWAIEPPATYSDLLETCQEIQAQSSRKIAPVAVSGNFELYAGMWFDQLVQRSCGADKIYNILNNTNDLPLAEENCLLRALESLAQLNNNQCLATGWQTMDAADSQDTFKNGEAAMIFMGSWMTVDLGVTKSPTYEYAAIPFPSLDNGEGNQNAIFGRALVWNVPAESDNPELAIEFLRRLTSAAAARRAVEELGIISALKNAPSADKPAGMGPVVEASKRSDAEMIALHYGLQFNQELAQVWYGPAIQVIAGQISPLKALNLLEQGLAGLQDSP